MSNIDETLQERGRTHGHFPDHALATQQIKEALRNGSQWDVLDDDQREALEMVAHKMGRIVCGNPDHIDHWTDIVGYTRLVEKRLIDEQSEQREHWLGPQEPDKVPEEEASMTIGEHLQWVIAREKAREVKLSDDNVTSLAEHLAKLKPGTYHVTIAEHDERQA